MRNVHPGLLPKGRMHSQTKEIRDAVGTLARVNGESMRDWRGIKAAIGDRVFYVTVDGTHRPEIHEAWVEEADNSHILARSTASAFGEVSGNRQETRRLKQPEDFIVVKGQGFL